MKKALGLLFLLWASLSFAGSTFLRQYEHAGEVITKVNTVKLADGYIILALEGYYTQTNTLFSRIQSFDPLGDLQDAYADAYIGEPSQLGSGLFEGSYDHYRLLTPVLTPLPVHKFRFDWQVSYYDSTGSVNFEEYILPDSLDTVVEFPTAISHNWDSSRCDLYLIGGRAIFNGIYRCFALNVDRTEQVHTPIMYFPGLQHISGLGGFDSYDTNGFLALGQANGWTGKIILLNRYGNVGWQQDFTDGADASQFPIFTTPLISNWELTSVQYAISYQNKDRIMHIDLYQNQSLQHIYSEQLDAYTQAIPLYKLRDTITFAYLKNGVQIIRQIDLADNTIWSRELPGIGSFGKNSLTYHGFMYTDISNFYISGRMSGGGYYVAAIDANNGSISYDVISQPENLKMSMYPNPCNDEVNVTFELKQSGKVKLELYNLKGQKITTLKNTTYPKGKFIESYSLSEFNRSNLPAGVYLLRLSQNGKQLTRKLFFMHRKLFILVPPAKN